MNVQIWSPQRPYLDVHRGWGAVRWGGAWPAAHPRRRAARHPLRRGRPHPACVHARAWSPLGDRSRGAQAPQQARRSTGATRLRGARSARGAGDIATVTAPSPSRPSHVCARTWMRSRPRSTPAMPSTDSLATASRTRRSSTCSSTTCARSIRIRRRPPSAASSPSGSSCSSARALRPSSANACAAVLPARS